MKHFLTHTTLVLSLAGANSAWAATDTGWQCTLLTDNAARLACFDTVYAAQMPPPKAIARPNQPKSKLDLVQSVDASQANNTTTLVMSQDEPALAPSPALSNAIAAYSPLSQLFDLDENDPAGILTVRAHRPMYLLPLWYNSSPNYTPSTPSQPAKARYDEGDKKIESKLQISFKTKIAEDLFKTRADLWFGYTQQSNWQVYNHTFSAPFRNTDYEPELFITQPVKAALPGGGQLRVLGAGLVHQSNGQEDPLSRSWNRIYATAGMEWGKLTVLPRIWWRVPDHDDDDNPDINDYMGYGDVRLQYRFDNTQTLGSTLRLNPKTGKGAAQIHYTFPVAGKLKGYVQGYYGYGENMLDYNHKHKSIGIGLMMNDWDGF